MSSAFSCASSGSMFASISRGPEASSRRNGVGQGAGYVVKPFAGSNGRHVTISARRNSTHSIRFLASKDVFFGKPLILRYFHQKRNVRLGGCRCATSEETYEEKQLTEKEARERMNKTLEAMKSNFNSIRTGRASPALLDRIEVEYYGSPVNLKSLAQVSATDGNSLLIQPFDKSSVKPIEKAIAKSNLGLTPSSDGNIIRLTIPQLTADRRKELLKVVGKMAEEAKVGIRNIRRDAIKSYEKQEKEKKLSKDNVKDFSDDMQKITDEYIKKVDSSFKEKEKELMTI